MSKTATPDTTQYRAQIGAIRVEHPRIMDRSIANPEENITPREYDCAVEKAAVEKYRARIAYLNSNGPSIKEEDMTATAKKKLEAEIQEHERFLEEAEEKYEKAKENLKQTSRDARKTYDAEREELSKLLKRLNDTFPQDVLRLISHGTIISASQDMEGLITPGTLYRDIETLHANRPTVGVFEAAQRYTKAAAPLEKLGKGAQVTWHEVIHALRKTWRELEDTLAELSPILVAKIVAEALGKVGTAGSAALIKVLEERFPYKFTREEARRDPRWFPHLFEAMADSQVTQALVVIHDAPSLAHGTAKKAFTTGDTLPNDICRHFNQPRGCSRVPCHYRHTKYNAEQQRAEQTRKAELGAKAGV